MLELIPTPDHVVAFRIGGKITAEEIDKISGALDEAIALHGSTAIFMEVVDIGGVTFKAFLKDLRYGFRHIGHLERFTRGAVVTDKKWLRSVADWEGKLLPGIEVRGFELEDGDDAMEWVSAAVPPPIPMLVPIDTSKPYIFAYKLTGTITGHDVRRVSAELEEAYAQHGTISLLVRVEKLSGFRPGVFGEHIVRFKRRALKHVDKYAVVGGPDWLEDVVEFLDPLFKMDMRHFDFDDEHEAWRWLEAEPVSSALELADAV